MLITGPAFASSTPVDPRAVVAVKQSTTPNRASVPSFVIHFALLLLFGPYAAMLVAAGIIAATRFLHRQRSYRRWRMIEDGVTVMLAIQAAALVHRALGGTMGEFVWPWQAVPIAAAVVAHCVVTSASADIIVPLISRRPINRSWPGSMIRVCPNYLIAGSVAVGIVTVVDHRAWEIVPVAAVPLFFAYRAYCDYMNRVDEEHHRGELIRSLDQGMAIIGNDGRVTLWNDALERIVGCPREQALGRSLVGALPTLAETDLPRAITDAVTSRSPRTLTHLGLPSATGARSLQVKILPAGDRVTLLWEDITERTRAEHALKRSEERLELAAAGANDGLWEWSLRSQECYFSARWKGMLGLPASAGVGRPEEWLDRVHADDIVALKAALEAHLAGQTDCVQHEHRIRHEDGTYRWFLCRGIAAQGVGRRPTRMAGSLTDTTERVTVQDRLRSVGFVDPLTGLCNRTMFAEGLGQRLADYKQRRDGGWFAVLYLDLDRFKVVNDSLGHLVGDQLLIAVSRRLESCLRKGDALARLGGDEFALLLNEVVGEEQANAIAFRIQEALSTPFSIGGREVFSSASIGIAFGNAQYTNPDEIMRDADTAMYQAKARGKARHELFDADMHARARDRLGLENDLRRAINTHDFEVHYQPIVFLASGRCIGFESLVRWSRDGKAISPAVFIPIAEELGLIEPLGTWVLQQACRTFAEWQRRFPAVGLECITVNVSSRQLVQANFLRMVEQALHDAKLNPSQLRLEITETALLDSPNVAAELLRDLRDFGVKIYLDDFGTGFSSLSHLHKLPVDALKIDRSFVSSLALPDRPAIVESILALAHTLNTSVVAEGVETDVQARELVRLGCTHAQGYLFSRPLSQTAAEELLNVNHPLGPRIQATDGAGETKRETDLYYSSGPFTWPEDVPLGHAPVPPAPVKGPKTAHGPQTAGTH